MKTYKSRRHFHTEVSIKKGKHKGKQKGKGKKKGKQKGKLSVWNTSHKVIRINANKKKQKGKSLLNGPIYNGLKFVSDLWDAKVADRRQYLKRKGLLKFYENNRKYR